MAVVAPTVTATDAHIYREQMERITPFASRIHVDMADGTVARKLVDPVQMWWPDGVTVDLHMMVDEPLKYLDVVLNLRPSLAIVQAEAKGDFVAFATQMREVGIKVGVALLPPTKAELLEPALG